MLQEISTTEKQSFHASTSSEVFFPVHVQTNQRSKNSPNSQVLRRSSFLKPPKKTTEDQILLVMFFPYPSKPVVSIHLRGGVANPNNSQKETCFLFVLVFCLNKNQWLIHDRNCMRHLQYTYIHYQRKFS